MRYFRYGNWPLGRERLIAKQKRRATFARILKSMSLRRSDTRPSHRRVVT